MANMSRREWLVESSRAALLLTSGCRGGTSVRTAPSSEPNPSTPTRPQAQADVREDVISPLAHEGDTDLPREQSGEEAPPVSQAPERSKIYIQPLGDELSAEDLDFVVTALGVFFPHPVVRLDAVALPQVAYYPPRSRYRAEKLLEYLEPLTPADAQVVMGLTEVDISTTKPPYEDWGILGLAAVGGKQCVISRFRAKRGATDPLHTRIRLAKTVVHEVGHTLGLRHCPNRGCLMEDGMGSVKTTDHEYDLCDGCRSEVEPELEPRNVQRIPWPRPS